MNIHTFKDVATSKRGSLANDLDDDDDDHDVAPMRREVEGEEDAGQEQFNDMGEAIEPFNLRNEREGGHFDENMNYVFQKERGEVDAWVAEMDEVSMERAIGEAAAAMKRKTAKREIDEQNEASQVKKTSLQLRKELLNMLEPGETLTRAMRRLGGKEDKNKGGVIKRRLPPGAVAEVAVATSSSEMKERARAGKASIHRITEIADELMASSAGGALTGIYEMTYESIQASTLLWEYKGLDEVVYGPYPAQTIAQWKAQGFMTGDTAVLMRACAEIQDVRAGGEGRSQVGRKAKLSSIYDEDDLAIGPADKKTKVSFSSAADSGINSGDNAAGDNNNDSSSSAAASAPFTVGPWVSSDDIDFSGAFVDLDTNNTTTETAVSTGSSSTASTTSKENRRVGSGSTAAVVRAVMALEGNGGNGSHHHMMSNEEEEDYDEEEDMGFRRRKGNKHNFDKGNDEEDD